MASESIVSENTDDKVLDFVTVSVEPSIPSFADSTYTHNFNNGVVYYFHKQPLTEDTYLESEIDLAITFYKKQAIDMFSLTKKIWCKIKLCTETYYHYAFELSPEICKACAELNIGIMVCF